MSSPEVALPSRTAPPLLIASLFAALSVVAVTAPVPVSPRLPPDVIVCRFSTPPLRLVSRPEVSAVVSISPPIALTVSPAAAVIVPRVICSRSVEPIVIAP